MPSITKSFAFHVAVLMICVFFYSGSNITVAYGQSRASVYVERITPALKISQTIKLSASPSVGDVGQNWSSSHKFPDYSTGFYFRWSYSGSTISKAAYEVRNNNGNILARVEIPAMTSGKASQFFVGLSGLTKGPAYSVRVTALNEMGWPINDPSNVVTLTFEQAKTIPFHFAQFEIDEFVERWDAPGAVGAALCPSGDLFEFASGYRKNGSPVRVQAGDLWHIGSDSKAFTAMMIGKLVEEGIIDWDTRLLEDLVYGDINLFPELKVLGSRINGHFREVTIEHLAGHRSGMSFQSDIDAPTRELENYKQNPTQFRWNRVQEMLTRDHSGQVGVFEYGNGNYMLLGVIIERLRGKPYEQVIEEEIFTPIGMTTAKFGMPADAAIPEPSGWLAGSDNPWVLDPDGALAVNTTQYNNGHCYPDNPGAGGCNGSGEVATDNLALPPVWNSAGGIYLSMRDWLNFLRVQTHGASGSFTLSPTTLAKLQAPYNLSDRAANMSGGNPNYGFAWGMGMDGAWGSTMWHDGTYGRFYAKASVYPVSQFAVVSVANIDGDGEDPSKHGDRVTGQILSSFISRAKNECPQPVVLNTPTISRQAPKAGDQLKLRRRRN